MDTLELLRKRNRHVLELPSGLWCKGVLPRLEECQAVGHVPLPLVMRYQRQIREEAIKAQIQAMRAVGTPEEEISKRLAANREPDPELTKDEQQRMFDYQNELVRRFLRAVATDEQGARNAEEIEFTAEMVTELDEPDWQEIVLWAGRDKTIPKAEESTSAGSSDSSDPSQGASTDASSDSGAETPVLSSTTT